MRRGIFQLIAAVRGFVRGFAGLESAGTDPAAVRRHLEGRAVRRRSCC